MIPYAWNDEPWWSDDQVLNLHAIVDDLKRRYNIDENRVVVAGVSDGGTGAYSSPCGTPRRMRAFCR